MKNVNIIYGISKAGLVRAGVASKKPETIKGNIVNLTGVGFFDDDVVNQETGEIENKTITVLAYEQDGKKDFVSSPSETLRNAITLLLETYDKAELEAGIPIMIDTGKSNAGRTFLTAYPVE